MACRSALRRLRARVAPRPLLATLASALLLACTWTTATAQALNPELAYGRDFTFERMVATREVRDAQDSGTIRLVTYVWRPLKNDRREVVLFSHGSTGGVASAPAEPAAAVPAPQVVRFLVARGYTVVAPMRRGRNESTGRYVEECSVFVGECTADDQLALGERGIREALLDTYAVIDQIVVPRLAPRDGRIIAAGHSRGGFLSLMLAGERPQLVKGVVNFAGGWHGVTDRLAPAQRQGRTDDHVARLTRAARATRVPTLWLYAARDALYQDGVPQAMMRAWQDAGGRAELVYAAEHTLDNGHQIPTAPALWARQLDDFLKSLP